ncbi:hypothetical protein BDY19DRAFT_992050 [Irpex rosettiformis]|uniref:Uncharacterized protein n=1 Tax=Irpex rosettiformis TaxID=378272 RepID=A0ACB8U8A2_9APHY|nr:hypothetical protein BDY19DRAFT_992050 [Irpex rosettiformis]
MSQSGRDTLASSTAPTAAASSELRHVTSNTNLAAPTKENRLSKRTSQHLRTHPTGTKSPASIPSSPTSVHSSSSAIFERDIEPLTPSPLLTHTTDPHRIPRGKLTEQLDQSVPTVLDSAAEALTLDIDDKEGMDAISIVAPVPFELHGGGSGFTSPISQMSSRSPSPNGISNRRSVLLNLPSPSPSFTLPLPLPLPLQSQTSQGPLAPTASPSRPTIQTSSPPTASAIVAAASATEDSSPTTATAHEYPLPALSGSSSPGVATPTTGVTLSSHVPPSPSSKRLSFISYTDLLTSAPASTLPLSSLTLSAQANEPPPHLPSVIGIPQAQAQGLASSAASIHGSISASAWVTERDPAADLVSDQGGEWQREGLGRGLEERLEALMSHDVPQQSPPQQPLKA